MAAEQEEFGKRLREIRKARKLTQGELAERLGISDSAVGTWEEGNCGPLPRWHFEGLMKALAVSRGDLCSVVGAPIPDISKAPILVDLNKLLDQYGHRSEIPTEDLRFLRLILLEERGWRRRE